LKQQYSTNLIDWWSVEFVVLKNHLIWWNIEFKSHLMEQCYSIMPPVNWLVVL